MKENFKNPLMQVYMEQQTSPVIKEVNGKDWVEYGIGDYSNNYPQFLVDLYYNSSTHAAIINATSEMIAGEEILVEESDNLEVYVKLKKFIANANSNESLHEVFKKLAFDLKLYGGYAINLIWSRDRTEISEIYHIPVQKLRSGVLNEHGKVDEYWISSDWGNYRKKENRPQSVAAYNTNDRTDASQILYSGKYSPGMDVYFTPDYVSGTNWILTDEMISEYHLSNISNGFSPSFWINFNNGIPTEEERIQVENSIKNKFTGANAAGKIVMTFNEDATRKPDIQPIQVSNADKQYTVLNELVVQNIMIAHRVTSPMLLGVKTAGQLGGRNELMEAYELYLSTVVKPYQNIILKSINKILNINDTNLPIQIEQFQPLSNKFGMDILKEVMTRDEIRMELGLEPLELEDEVLDDEVENEFSKIPTDKDVIKHIDSLEVESEYDLADEWDLIFEEKVDNKQEFLKTGAINPSGKGGASYMDSDIYKVRYVYRGGGVQSTTRDFCRHMMSTHYTSLFSRDDINMMSSSSANDEFGQYNIFAYKGSFNCRHYWLRRVYVLRKAPKAMTIDGKELKKGDYLPKSIRNYVSRNKGYIPKDSGVPSKTSAEITAGNFNPKVIK